MKICFLGPSCSDADLKFEKKDPKLHLAMARQALTFGM